LAFRRDLETVLATHALDPTRCDLFVEGEEDRRVLLYLVGDSISPGASVTSVENIDVDVDGGGNRERLVELARRLEGVGACILCFVDAGLDPSDADYERLVQTDGPDLEGYVLQSDCVEKFLRLGLRTDSWEPGSLLVTILQRARRLGILRVASDRQGWSLPFQRTELRRHVIVDVDSDIQVDEVSFIEVLLQNADLSLTLRDEVVKACDALERELAERADQQLAHGKDVFCLFGEIAFAAGGQRSEARGILWTALERRVIAGFENLGLVLAFLENCCGGQPAATS
jgi:hypothetical protein